MSPNVWSVIEFRPQATGSEWADKWLSTQQDRLEWQRKNLDDIKYTAHQSYEDNAAEIASNRDSGWIALREGDLSSAPPTLQALWGVTNVTSFTPVADRRGIPETVSPFARAYYESWMNKSPAGERYFDCFGESYLTFADIETVDWSTEADYYTDKIPVEKTQTTAGDGNYVATTNRPLSDARLTRREAMADDWWNLIETLEQKADEFGSENIRLTVWFS